MNKKNDLTKIVKGKMLYTKMRNPHGVVFEVVTHPIYGIKTALSYKQNKSTELVSELIEQSVSIDAFVKEANFVVEARAEMSI